MARRPRKRGNGEGTVYQTKAGGWRAAYTVGWKPDGRPIRKSASGATRKEAIDRMMEKMAGYRYGRPVTSADESVQHYLTRWLEDRIRGSVRESSYDRYDRFIRSVEPYIGALKLSALAPSHIQAMYQDMAKTNSPATLSRLRAVLHHAFEGAIEWDLIHRNPAKYADPPKVEKKDRRSLSPTEARTLFAAVADDRMQPLWVVLATCGLRISEALALTWADIEGDYITVRKGKTEAAARTIPLFADAADALRRREQTQRIEKMQNRDIWQESELIFTTKTGLPIYPSSAWRSFKKSLRYAGLPDMRLHDLRRTAVAWLREAGVDADVVQAILGHEHISTTLDIYGSVNKGRLEDARRKLDAYLGS